MMVPFATLVNVAVVVILKDNEVTHWAKRIARWNLAPKLFHLPAGSLRTRLCRGTPFLVAVLTGSQLARLLLESDVGDGSLIKLFQYWSGLQ